MSMRKIAMQSDLWLDQNDPLTSLTWLKERGFDGIDYSLYSLCPAGKMLADGEILPSVFDQDLPTFLAGFAPLKEALETSGVSICQMHAPFPLWNQKRPAVTAHLNEVLDKTFALCEYLSCPAVVVHPVVHPTLEEEWEDNLAFYRSLFPLLKERKGFTVCLENMFWRKFSRLIEAGMSAPDYARMIDQLNEELGETRFGFCFDVGHAIIAGRDPAEYIRKMGHRLTVLHLHENNVRDDLHVMPYMSLLRPLSPFCDWEGVLAALREVGYEGPLAFETFGSQKAFPKAVHKEVFELNADIGRYFVQRLEG